MERLRKDLQMGMRLGVFYTLGFLYPTSARQKRQLYYRIEYRMASPFNRGRESSVRPQNVSALQELQMEEAATIKSKVT